MRSTAESTLRRELRAAGLPPDRDSVLLLGLLRGSPEPHLTLHDVLRMLADERASVPNGVAEGLLDAFVTHGLIGRLMMPNGATVFDAVAECHSHLLDETSGHVVDLQVSPETLSAIVTRMIAEHGRCVDITVRIRRP